MLKDWINAKYLDAKRISGLRKQFSKAFPFPHHALQGFFREDKLVNIYKSLQTLEYLPKESDLFKFSQTGDFKAVKIPILKKFYEFFRSKEFTDYIRSITGKKKKKGQIDMSS